MWLRTHHVYQQPNKTICYDQEKQPEPVNPPDIIPWTGQKCTYKKYFLHKIVPFKILKPDGLDLQNFLR